LKTTGQFPIDIIGDLHFEDFERENRKFKKKTRVSPLEPTSGFEVRITSKFNNDCYKIRSFLYKTQALKIKLENRYP
jgi:hypothetical protein